MAETSKCDGKVYEYDGSFKCYKCGAFWGQVTTPDAKTHAVSGEPENPHSGT
jgi:hypothetical protein